MKMAFTPRFAAALAALALWALVAASALYWVWRVRTPPLANAPLAGNPGELEQAADPQAVALALGAGGARAAAGTEDGRFVLRGVVTHGPDAGAALIAVDGKPPKPVRVGAPVPDADGWTLRAVTPGGAELAGGAREVTLNVPQPDTHLDTHADLRPQTPQMPYGLPADMRSPAAPMLPAGRRMMMPPQPSPQPPQP